MAKKDVQTAHSIEVTLKPGQAKTKDSPAVRPITRTVKAGSLFSMEEGPEMDELRKAGAIIEPNGKHLYDLRAGFAAEDAERDRATGSLSTNPGAGSNPAPAGAELRTEGGEGDEGGEGAGSESAEHGTKPQASKQTGSSAKGRSKGGSSGEDLV